MGKMVWIFVLLLSSACASPPKVELTRAPVVGFVRSLRINGQPVPRGVCKLWIQYVKLELNEGEYFRAEVPIGSYKMGSIECDQGFLRTNYSIPINYKVDVKANELNLLGEFEWELGSSAGALQMAMVGGEINGSFLARSFESRQIRTFLAANPQWQTLRRNQALNFDRH